MFQKEYMCCAIDRRYIHPKVLEKLSLFMLWLISKNKTHGYELIKLANDGKFSSAKASKVYPLLNEMLEEGLISQTEKNEGKRIRKVYAITETGRRKIKDGKKLFSGALKEFLREMIEG